MLPEGYRIKTTAFKDVVVHLTKNKKTGQMEPLGEGGQGAVYIIDYDGKPGKVLKWYTGEKFKDAKKFYENLQNNIKKGAPTKAFLWPEDITEFAGNSFGYIMNLRPPEYQDFSKYIIGRDKNAQFKNTNAMVSTALHITAGFRALHKAGYSYQDLNDGNFFFNPTTGDVLICDNDNVSEYGKNSGIAGKARYMAPEIVAEGKKPNMETDAFSLAVILFRLWVRDHPLEGKIGAGVPCLNAKYEKQIYGTNPVFIYDDNDTSNRPVPGTHKGAIALWPQLPVYLRDMFKKAFSKEVMHDPNKRIIEREWIHLFVRMRSEIYKCPCGEVYFADPVNPNPCPGCKKKNTFPMYIKTKRNNLPLHQRLKLYACHTEADNDDYETLSAEAVANGSNFELKNVSGKNWTATEGANTISVAPGKAVVLKKGLVIDFGGAKAEII